MNRTSLGAVITATLTLMIATTPLAANASSGDTNLQKNIDATLAEYPGGVQVGDDTIEWDDGAITMTFPGGTSSREVAGCATGSYCAWSQSSYGGTKLSFTTCSAGGSSNSLVPLGQVRSVANARTSGTVEIRNGSTTVYTLAANSGKPTVSGTLTTAVCFT